MIRFAMVCFMLAMWVVTWTAFTAYWVAGVVCGLITLAINALVAEAWEELE